MDSPSPDAGGPSSRRARGSRRRPARRARRPLAGGPSSRPGSRSPGRRGGPTRRPPRAALHGGWPNGPAARPVQVSLAVPRGRPFIEARLLGGSDATFRSPSPRGQPFIEAACSEVAPAPRCVSRRPLAGGPSSRLNRPGLSRRAPSSRRPPRAALHRGLSAGSVPYSASSPSPRGRPFIEATREGVPGPGVVAARRPPRAALHRGTSPTPGPPAPPARRPPRAALHRGRGDAAVRPPSTHRSPSPRAALIEACGRPRAHTRRARSPSPRGRPFIEACTTARRPACRPAGSPSPRGRPFIEERG